MTSQPVGGVAVSATFSIVAVPVFVRMNCCWVGLPAPPWADRRPPGPVSVIEYEPVKSTAKSPGIVCWPALTSTWTAYWPAAASSGGSAVTLMLVVPPASTTVEAACWEPAISAVTSQSGWSVTLAVAETVTSCAVSLWSVNANGNVSFDEPVSVGLSVVIVMSPVAAASTRTEIGRTSSRRRPRRSRGSPASTRPRRPGR